MEIKKQTTKKKTVKKNKGGNKGHDNLIPCKPGQTANPNGRPKGQRDYKTIYREALIKIGKTQNMTPEEIEETMEQVGLKKALKGDFRFQKDIKDRLHGKAEIKADVKVDATLKTIIINKANE